MDLPTKPGLYLDDPGEELWQLRTDGLWQNVGRPLRFGGIELYATPAEPVTSAELKRLDGPLRGGTYPRHPIDLMAVRVWHEGATRPEWPSETWFEQ